MNVLQAKPKRSSVLSAAWPKRMQRASHWHPHAPDVERQGMKNSPWALVNCGWDAALTARLPSHFQYLRMPVLILLKTPKVKIVAFPFPQGWDFHWRFREWVKPHLTNVSIIWTNNSFRRIEKSWDKQTGKNLAVDTSLGSGSSGLGFLFFYYFYFYCYLFFPPLDVSG